MAKTSTLALMRRAPSRHVFSSSIMTEDSDTEPQVSAAVRPVAPAGPYAPNMHDYIPEEHEVDVFFDANTAAKRYFPDGTTARLTDTSNSGLPEPEQENLSTNESSPCPVTPLKQRAYIAAGPMPESALQSGYGSPVRISANGGPLASEGRGAPAPGHSRGGVRHLGQQGDNYVATGSAGPEMLQPPPQWPQQPPPPRVRCHSQGSSSLTGLFCV
jgi:hypothetical protein